MKKSLVSMKYRTTHEYQYESSTRYIHPIPLPIPYIRPTTYESSTRYIQTQNTKEQETKLCANRDLYKMCFMN